MLEDTPEHVYFLLATTDPDKLIPAILTRCTKINFQPIIEDDLVDMMKGVVEKESKTISDKVLRKIASYSNGSAREAMVMLNTIFPMKDEEQQLSSIQPPSTEAVAYQLAKLLLWERGSWREVSEVISKLSDGENWEGIRHLILSIAGKEMLKEASKHQMRALQLYEVFQYDWFQTKKAGLIASCFKVLHIS